MKNYKQLDSKQQKEITGGGLFDDTLGKFGEFVGNSTHNFFVNRAQHLINNPRRRGLGKSWSRH